MSVVPVPLRRRRGRTPSATAEGGLAPLLDAGLAFSELAASLNDHGVKLAPAAVWGNMHSVAATIEHNATLTYPEGEIDDDATKEAINTLHRYRLTRAHKANDQKVEL